MKRIGLCGGTYDPIHNGHAALIRAAAASGYLDRCIVMPAGLPPHKLTGHFSPAAYRVAMAEAAFRGVERISVSDLEISSRAPSYTLRTIEKITAGLDRGDELVLVYGSDILLDIENWYQPQEIMAKCGFYLAKRGGYNENRIKATAERLRHEFNARITFFDCPQIELSSTDIRQAISNNLPWRHMVPEEVASFIENNGLYRNLDGIMALDDDKWLDLMRLEQRLWQIMPRSRLIHSLNTMSCALHLALLHNADLIQAGQAAILHDCAKDLPWHEQRRLAEKAGDSQLLHPALAHGPAGAIRARSEFAVSDPAVFRSIVCHTTGCPGMSKLDKIIFLADKIEPSRTYSNLEQIRALAESDLDRAMLLCIDEINSYLKREKISSHPYTSVLRDELKQRLK